jgi:isopentenyldiphosphate isomerase
MNQSKIIIVNENDKIIKYKKRSEIKQDDIYRVSALWVQNSKGEILLAQRKFNKKNSPGKWGPAVAGTVERGESYESNIIKEAREEIGLKNIDFQIADKTRRKGKHNYFRQWFLATVDKNLKEFIIQDDEVEKIKWFKKDDLIIQLKNNPNKFLRSVKGCVGLFCK